jgi:hypothetical protein
MMIRGSRLHFQVVSWIFAQVGCQARKWTQGGVSDNYNSKMSGLRKSLSEFPHAVSSELFTGAVHFRHLAR